MEKKKKTTSSFSELLETVHRLRAPGGCPWDREQTHQSLRPYLIEEAYEVLDVLDQIPKDVAAAPADIQKHFKEELGDLLMQVLLHSEMASETGSFNFEDVAQELNNKLIRRHPHVFGDASARANAKDSAAALGNWEAQKAEEKKKQADPSILSGLPKNLPALQKTERVIEKVSRVGFQWKDLTGPMEKLEEELHELKTEIKKEKSTPKEIENELGDLLFSICNVAYFFKIKPEDALRNTLSKFERRFRYVETQLAKKGRGPQDSNLEEMDRYWNEAKAEENKIKKT